MEIQGGKAGSDGVEEPRGHDVAHYPTASELYLLRLWVGLDDAGQNEWHGKLQHIVNGRAHHFRGWYSLVDLLTALLPNADRFMPLRDHVPEKSETGDTKLPER